LSFAREIFTPINLFSSYFLLSSLTPSTSQRQAAYSHEILTIPLKSTTLQQACTMANVRQNKYQPLSRNAQLQGWNAVAKTNIDQHLRRPSRDLPSSNIAAPRSSLPSNVHGHSMSISSANSTNRSSWEDSNHESQSYERPAISHYARVHAAVDQAKRVQPQSSQGYENLPPHLRGVRTQAFYGSEPSHQQYNNPAVTKSAQATPLANSGEPRATSKPQFAWQNAGPTGEPSDTFDQLQSAQLTPLAPPMNPGTAAKSAKHDSKFPCLYKDCTQGFGKLPDLKAHKSEEHYYCKVCDVDCEDDDDFLNHKVASERHICCHECGEDFRSESGRDRHLRLVRFPFTPDPKIKTDLSQSHGPQQEVKCIGCDLKFSSGAGLMAHVYNNQCRGRGNNLVNRLNRNIMQENRAKAALHLDALAFQHADPRPWQSQTGSVADDSSVGGGVMVQPSLLDSDVPGEGTSAQSLNLMDDDDDMISMARGPGSTVSSDSDAATVKCWPVVESEKPSVKGKQPVESVTEDMDALSVASKESKAHSTTTVGWSKALFANAKPTPASPGWTAPKASPIGGRTAPAYAQSQGSSGTSTDWDHMSFEQDPDGKYKCPFAKCGYAILGFFHQLKEDADRCITEPATLCFKILNATSPPATTPARTIVA